jgi:RND superfamily putative drug exporter
MLPAAALGMKLTLANRFVQDTISEMSPSIPSVRDLKFVSSKFGPGIVAPMTVLIRSDRDLRDSEGLALIDDVSRLLARQRGLAEVRSATQPLGSTAPLEPARLGARLAAVNEGFGRMEEGARQLESGLTEGAAKLRMAVLLDDLTGGSVLGKAAAPSPATAEVSTAPESISGGLLQATSGLLGGRLPSISVPPTADPTIPITGDGPREALLRQLTQAAQGAHQIADGTVRARSEIRSILADPVGQRALDRLLINQETVDQNPALQRSFRAYFSEDGETARIDIIQSERAMSPEALDRVAWLRSRLHEFFGGGQAEQHKVEFLMAGGNPSAADIRAITRVDQAQSWVVVPLGVFLVLLVGLRNPLTCLNLVGTMFLTYSFSLGVTHALFVWGLGCEGIDWKVPYFLFVLLIAVGVDYNVFLMSRLTEETRGMGLLAGIIRAVGQTGSLISSAAAITACSFAALMFSPLVSLQQLGFSLVLGIVIDAVLVRPLLVPCGHWLINRSSEPAGMRLKLSEAEAVRVVDS